MTSHFLFSNLAFSTSSFSSPMALHLKPIIHCHPLAARRPLKSTSTHRQVVTNCANTPFPELDSHMMKLRTALQPHLLVISSEFVAPYHEEIHKTHHVAVGTRVESTLVVTSAYAVGRIAIIPFKDDSGSTLYEGYLGSCIASAPGGRKSFNLTPLAVSFSDDIAVLKLEAPKASAPVCPVVGYPPAKESLMMSLTYNEEMVWPLSIELANVRGVGKKSIKVKAPWAFDDKSTWLEYDQVMFQQGPPPPTSLLFDGENLLQGSVSGISGSPWFNLWGELVGIASWEFRDGPANFLLGYAASAATIRTVVDYAKNKGIDDPIIMDNWIKIAVDDA